MVATGSLRAMSKESIGSMIEAYVEDHLILIQTVQASDLMQFPFGNCSPLLGA